MFDTIINLTQSKFYNVCKTVIIHGFLDRNKFTKYAEHIFEYRLNNFDKVAVISPPFLFSYLVISSVEMGRL